MMRRQLPNVRVDAKFFPLVGGFDQTTPPLVADPGLLRDVQNFECDINGGYSLVVGYERYDGTPRPSFATYTTLPAAITGTWAVGDTLTGVTSGATAKVIGASDIGLIITKVTGTFAVFEDIQIGGVTIGTCSGGGYAGGDYTSEEDAIFLALAAQQQRLSIGAVPGSGPIRGVWVYDDFVWAFRDDASATKTEMYRSGGSGWTKVTFYNEVSFTAGSGALLDNGVLTQGGVTADIKRVVLESGSLGSGTGVGRLIITNPAGGNFAAGAATGGGGSTLTLAGAQTAITLATGGRYEFVTTNFGGSSPKRRMYGADGVNRAFEFDGQVFVPLRTGMAQDKPKYITEHKNHLFLSFGHSVQHSGISNPYAWAPILGAAEINAGDEVTGMKSQVGTTGNGALLIVTRSTAKMLYGNSASDWDLQNIQSESGAFAYSIQQAGNVIMLDDRGIEWLAATQNFGNFEQATLSHKYKPWLLEQKSKIIASCVIREKNQYRLFFQNGYAIYLTLSGTNVIGACPVFMPHTVRCICSVETSDGAEKVFFGSDDGYVRQMERGTSWDGEPIDFWAILAFAHLGSPRVTKQWRKAVFEISGPAFVKFDAGYTLGYASREIEQPISVEVQTGLSPYSWDNFTWDAFTWDGQPLSPTEFTMDGTAENCSLAITGSSDYIKAFTITGIIFHYTVRTRIR